MSSNAKPFLASRDKSARGYGGYSLREHVDALLALSAREEGERTRAVCKAIVSLADAYVVND